MKSCNCYEIRTGWDSLFGSIVEYGICLGTKECAECNCEGDESKCDFYPEKRKKVNEIMKTAEMWLAAQKDGKTYVSEDAEAIYSRKLGLVEKYNLNEEVSLGDFPDFNHLMNSNWIEMEAMTKAEAEKRFGIKIIG